MLEFFTITSALFTLNPWMGAHVHAVKIGQRIALLRPVLPEEFAYPDWQAGLSVSLFSIMGGLAANSQWTIANDASVFCWAMFAWGFMATGGCFLLVVSTLRWWSLRGCRSLGSPSFFKVFAAAWLLPTVLGSGLLAAGWPAVWVTVILGALMLTSFHALRCATPWLRSSSLISVLALAYAAVWILIVTSRIQISLLLKG